MADNSKRIKKVIKYINQFSKFQNKLQKALEKIDWPIPLFFISITNEIILELEKINTKEQAPKTHKRMSSNITNNNIYIEKSGKTYLYQMINIFDEIKNYNNEFTIEVIEYIITPENIQKILHILMATNKIKSTNPNIIKERNEFNSYIMNLLINIINLNNKILIDVLSTESQYNVFYQLFFLLSKNEENRHLLYELERNIFIYYPNNNNLKELIKNTIDCIEEELSISNCKTIINEIKIILFLFKQEINIINKNMKKLIIKIFSLFEEEIDKHNFINDFLKFCFSEICFDGNNKFYKRYIANINKAKTINARSSNSTIDSNNQMRNTQISKSNSINSNINNYIRDNTIKFNNANDIEKHIYESKSLNEKKTILIEKEDKSKDDINTKEKENSIIKNDETKINKYNPQFMNFLLEIYNEFINLKMKNSYNIFFIELFLSINNSDKGKKEYSFLINDTNYIKVILSSLYKLKDESLLAVYFSKLIFLSLENENNNKVKKENNYYLPEIDLNFLINNIHLFLDDDEDAKIIKVITSQIINLIKMNNNIIDIILNKCNIFESFLSIVNNDKYNNEIKNRMIELMESILFINNNKFKYTLKIPIITYNINDNLLIKKIYLTSLQFENNANEFNNKIILIVNYMDSLFKQNKIDELFIFFEILLDGLYKNILQISNYSILGDEVIKKINNILYDISLLIKEESIVDLKLYNEFIISLLKFQYNYNKKYINFHLNKTPTDNKNKIIIEDNTILMIINNIFNKEQNEYFKIDLINKLYIYSLDLDENANSTAINTLNNNDENNNNNNNNYLLKGANILIKLINLLYEIKDYKSLEFIINNIISLIKSSILNIKIIVNNKEFIQIIIKLLIELYNNKNEEKLFNQINFLLKEISQYLSKSFLIQYLNELYILFYSITKNSKDENESNSSDNYKYIFLELFNILKKAIISSKNNIYDFLSLSNVCFSNPYIYNLFFIKDLYFDISTNIYICLDMNIRISTYNNIGIFHLVDFINEKKDIILSFSITNGKKLIISENLIKGGNKKEIFLEINNINNLIMDDGNFHKITIIINTKIKKLYFEVDKEITQLSDINTCSYNLFEFDEFDILIGYNTDSIITKLKTIKSLLNIPIIDINNILLTKFNEIEEYNIAINKKKDMDKNNIILETINNNNNYLENNDYESLENNIISDINFKNKNINIIKSNKIKKEVSIINDFYSNNDSKVKYVSLFDIYIPSNLNTVNSHNIKFYMFSLINNVEEYFSFNNSNKIILYNINKEYIKSHIFYNYNISLNACNYFFIDFLFCFLFDMTKGKNIIEIKNNNEEIDTKNEERKNETFFIDTFLIIFEIIIELPSKMITDYFLYKNDIISIKLKIFFYRNIEFFNKNSEFIQKLFQILFPEQNASTLETENKNQEFLLVIFTEIFTDLIIFQKLNFDIQNKILIKLVQLLSSNINYHNYYVILFKLLKNIYNIILYYELSLDNINYKLDEENNNPTQIDILIILIKSIILIFETNKNQEYLDKITNLNLNINNFFLNYSENNKAHNVQNFINENKSLIECDFLGKESIYNQIQKIITFFSSKYGNDYFEIKENNNREDLVLNYYFKNNKICSFCLYISNYFKIKYKNINDNLKFDKILDNNDINMYLNFLSYRQTSETKNFAWFLSRNESSHKIQNKFFLKKNDIKEKKQISKKLNNTTFTYEYLFDEVKYILTIKSLYGIFLFDKICNDFCLINIIPKINDKEINYNSDENDIIENCLYIKTIHKTLSIIMILKEYILILTNICVDSKQKLHVVKNEIDVSIWCLSKEEYEKELEDYISKNDKKLINEFFQNDKEKNKKVQKGFGYNNSYNFSYKKIYYKNISEIHKVPYLTIPNSIEIFMKNGKSHFICLNMSKREKIYMDIISKINNFYKNKNQKIEGFTELLFKKSNKNTNNDIFYMRYCPITYLENHLKEYSTKYGLKKSSRKKTNSVHNLNNISNSVNIGINYNKAIVSINTFLSEASDLWAKNKISNYDYIMLLNIFSGRSLNNLSQYFIFPRLLNDFNHKILNWISSSIYRDLSYPILPSEPSLRSDIKNKYDLSSVDKYHSGTFYSTYAFISYFLIRQRPFSEISLEIQGGEFDATDRLFIGVKEICSIKEKYQESIPALMTLPELYINNNKFNFGKTQKNRYEVNDFDLPIWSKNDPRKFCLVIKRIFETKNINIKLNKWINLIFGVAQSGSDAVKYLNTYRKACYELSFDEIEDLKNKNELLGILLEKQELGYNAKQIFKKSHKKKEKLAEYKEFENYFFDSNLKLRKIKFIKINNYDYNKEKNDIIFNSINDFLIDIDNDYVKNIDTINNIQGGIGSLKSVFSAFNINNNSSIIQKYNNPLKIINLLEKINQFIILGKGFHFLGKNYEYILCYKEQYLEIINYKLDIYYCYYLNEYNNISALITNDKGSKIYVGFDNGNIIEYKVIFDEEESLIEYMNKKEIDIHPIIKYNILDKFNLKYNNIYLYSQNEENITISLKRSETKKIKKINKKKKTNHTIPIILLQKNFVNNFTFNNPHIPEKIIKLKLNEENKILIAMTVSNIIYLISLNNKFKLMHIINYYSNCKYQYKLIDIIPFAYNGDFLIYSSMMVHLFSINGVPLCELNLLDNAYKSITPITCCRAVFLYDVILFTGHKDSSIIIWKIINKNTVNKDKEVESNDNNEEKSFLNEYYYSYDFEDEKKSNYDIQKCQLKREFKIVNQIKMEDNLNNSSISYMRMSEDMSYMIILDNKKDIYILSNFDDYKEENSNNSSGTNINSYNNGVFAHFRERKIYCISCCKEIEDNYYRVSRVQSLSFDQSERSSISLNDSEDHSIKNEEEINNNEDKINKEINYICQECKLKLINTESYLYNY